jgi:AcrR family transcriptional regulator
MAGTSPSTPRRSTYRHGDLRRALIEAGTELARDSGPDAVVLREATRRVGVAPNAAYRHFADRQALLTAVCAAAQSAMAAAIEAELAKVTRADDPAVTGWARLRAVGTGYLRFAQAEPGLFRTAFSVPTDLQEATSPNRAGPGGLTPFQLLAAALDELVDVGVVPAQRRPDSEFLAWSAVHGLAVLLIEGPLRGLEHTETHVIEQRLLDMIEHGLSHCA